MADRPPPAVAPESTPDRGRPSHSREDMSRKTIFLTLFRNVCEFQLALHYWRAVSSYVHDEMARAEIAVSLLTLTPECFQVEPWQLRAAMRNNPIRGLPGGMDGLALSDCYPRLVAPPSGLCDCGGLLGPLRPMTYSCRTLVTVNHDAVKCVCYEATCLSGTCGLVTTASYMYKPDDSQSRGPSAAHNLREYKTAVPFEDRPYFVASRFYVFEAGYFPLHLVDLERTSLSAQALEEMVVLKQPHKPLHVRACLAFFPVSNRR